MDEASKELYQLKLQQSSGRVDQCTQTSQSNGCNCNCTNSSLSANQEPNDLEALKKYHEDLEGTVSQLEVRTISHCVQYDLNNKTENFVNFQ